MKLPMRLLLALLVIVIGFSVGMAALLNYFKFESTIRKLEGARFSLVANDIGHNIELSLGLGLAFGEIGTVQELIERHRASDRLILSIDALDHLGRIRYSSQPERLGTQVPAQWLAVQRQSRWSFVKPDAFVAGRTVRNAFDVVVGGVTVRYDRRQTDSAVARMGRQLTAVAAALTAVLTVLGAAALFAVARWNERTLARAESGFGGSSTPGSRSVLDAEVRAFRDSVERACRDLDEARTLSSSPVVPGPI